MSRWYDEWNAERSAYIVERLIAEELQKVLHQYKPTPDALEIAARQIFTVCELGRADEHVSNRPASNAATAKELKTMRTLCNKLADHIDAMHNPALSELAKGGLFIRDMIPDLRNAAHAAHDVYIEPDDAPPPRSRPPEIEAAEVTTMTAVFYESITGNRPTRSVDQGEYGLWLDTLRAVFNVLDIQASAENQAKTHIAFNKDKTEH